MRRIKRRAAFIARARTAVTGVVKRPTTPIPPPYDGDVYYDSYSVGYG